METKPNKVNCENYDTLHRLFRKMGVSKDFFGNVMFTLKHGAIVQTDIHDTKKPEDLMRILDP